MLLNEKECKSVPLRHEKEEKQSISLHKAEKYPLIVNCFISQPSIAVLDCKVSFVGFCSNPAPSNNGFQKMKTQQNSHAFVIVKRRRIVWEQNFDQKIT